MSLRMIRLGLMTALAAFPLLGLCASGGEDVKSATVGQPFQVAPQSGPQVNQMSSDAAFDGENTWLVVWAEGAATVNVGMDIKAARVRSDGTCLDPAGIDVCKARNFQEAPRVAFCPASPAGSAAASGGNWLVVWSDFRLGKDYDLYGTRVTREGKVLEPDGALLYGGAGNQCWAAVGSNGSEFLLAWMDSGNGKTYHVFLGRVSAEGKALDGTGTNAFGGGEYDCFCNPRVVWNGKNWIVSEVHGGWGESTYRRPEAGVWSPDLKPVRPPQTYYVWIPWDYGVVELVADGSVTMLVVPNRPGWIIPMTRLGAAGELLSQEINGPWPRKEDENMFLSFNVHHPNAQLPKTSFTALSPRLGSRWSVSLAASDGIFLAVCSGSKLRVYDAKGVPEKEVPGMIFGLRYRVSDGKALDGCGEQVNPFMINGGHQRGIVGDGGARGGKDGQFLVFNSIVPTGTEFSRIEARLVQAK